LPEDEKDNVWVVQNEEELSDYDLILKDAKTPFPGTPLSWPKVLSSR